MALWDALEGESAKAFAAFKLYLRMGNTRSLPRVSKELGHSAGGTVQGWSSKFKWRDRVLAFESNDFEQLEGNQIKLLQHNQAQVLYDMYTDYNAMLELWRSELHKAMGGSIDPEVDPMSIKDLKNLIEARQTIDTMGRRVSGLPLTFRPLDNEERTPELPTGQMLILPSAIDMNTSYDEEDYDDGETS